MQPRYTKLLWINLNEIYILIFAVYWESTLLFSMPGNSNTISGLSQSLSKRRNDIQKKKLRIKANHAYLIQFSPAEKLLLSLHRSLFPHFFRSSFSRWSTNFWLLPLAENAASLRWNKNESLRFLIRFQATKQANLERPGRSYIRCQNSLFRTFFFSLLDECMTAWFPIFFNVDSRLKLLFPALVVQWNRCEDSFDDYLHILFS